MPEQGYGTRTIVRACCPAISRDERRPRHAAIDAGDVDMELPGSGQVDELEGEPPERISVPGSAPGARR